MANQLVPTLVLGFLRLSCVIVYLLCKQNLNLRCFGKIFENASSITAVIPTAPGDVRPHTQRSLGRGLCHSHCFSAHRVSQIEQRFGRYAPYDPSPASLTVCSDRTGLPVACGAHQLRTCALSRVSQQARAEHRNSQAPSKVTGTENGFVSSPSPTSTARAASGEKGGQWDVGTPDGTNPDRRGRRARSSSGDKAGRRSDAGARLEARHRLAVR